MSDYQSFPFQLRDCVWELTLECCFSCAYCGSRAGRKRENELTTAACLDVSRQLGEMGCRRVSLIGGEVFMRPDWEEIASSLTSQGIKVCIITNGFDTSEEVISALRRVKAESVAVSLDGEPAVHDAFRCEGSFDAAKRAVFTLADAGIPVSIITSLRSDNAARLDRFYDCIKDFPIFAWQIQACSPMGNAAGNSLDVTFDAEQVIEFIARIRDKAPFAVGAADNIGYYTPEESLLRGPGGQCFGGCSAGLTCIGIDSAGNVRGCESMYDERFNEGNLREESLMDIWMRPGAFSYNRDFTPSMLTGRCASCPDGEICAGGCRSYNFFSAGKLYENPLCARKAD